MSGLYRFPENGKAAGAALCDQIAKLREETREVSAAYYWGEGDKRLIEELWDVVQAAEGCLRKFEESAVSEGLRFVLEKCRERGDYGERDA